MPLMVTCIRRRPEAEHVIVSEVAMARIGAALAIEPDLLRQWQQGQDNVLTLHPVNWKNKELVSTGAMAAVKLQRRRLGRRSTPGPTVSQTNGPAAIVIQGGAIAT